MPWLLPPLETGSYPYGARNAPYLMEHLAQSVNAGIVEETVMLAFVVVTLVQAKRLLWEIVSVAVILRGLFHVYYGHWYRPRSVVPPTVLLILVFTTCGALALLVKHHREWVCLLAGPVVAARDTKWVRPEAASRRRIVEARSCVSGDGQQRNEQVFYGGGRG